MRPGRVNGDHGFGMDGSNKMKATVEFEDFNSMPTRPCELKLISCLAQNTNPYIWTNKFSFAAFGEDLAIGEKNAKGEYFYWTYDRSEATEPATAGTLPTGLRFHYAGRPTGTAMRLR